MLSVIGEVYASGGFTSVSDLRLKKDVKPINYGLNAVIVHRLASIGNSKAKIGRSNTRSALAPRTSEKVIPEVVTTANDDMKTKSVAYGALVPVLVKAIQEQQQEIASLKQAINELKAPGVTVAALETVPQRINL